MYITEPHFNTSNEPSAIHTHINFFYKWYFNENDPIEYINYDF
jgi:hypothetical protein